MAKNVIMPALEMAQETGKLVRWLKHDGETVAKGEPIMEVETDKVTVEIPSPDSGILGGILIKEGDDVPVGQTIAWLLAPGEKPPSSVPASSGTSGRATSTPAPSSPPKVDSPKTTFIDISPLARKMAEENNIDLALLKSNGRRIEKADVLAFLKDEAGRPALSEVEGPVLSEVEGKKDEVSSTHPSSLTPYPLLVPASPKARRLALERGIDLATISGSGPDGAVLVTDVENVKEVAASTVSLETPGTVWRVMAEHMSVSWTTVPHFYLMREIDATHLIEWRKRIIPIVEKRNGVKPTVTDLLVKLIGSALCDHPRVNASWADGNIKFNENINVGIATAIEEGLIVPVIRSADSASVGEIAAQRRDLIERAQNRKLRPADISDGTFTLSNLGMYNVDAFNAIVNTPQAAILAVGKIADRVVPVNGEIKIRPMMVLTLSCDHRVVDGARGALFLDHLANLIEDPLSLLA